MKRVRLAGGLLEAEVPEDWVVRTVTNLKGGRVDFTSPARYAEWELQYIPEDLGTVVHRTHEPLEQFAEGLMATQVRQGQPERFDEVIGDVPAKGYAWTDGVRNIATWFAQPATGIVVEINLSLPGLLDSSRTDRDPVALGHMLLGKAQWFERQ